MVAGYRDGGNVLVNFENSWPPFFLASVLHVVPWVGAIEYMYEVRVVLVFILVA